MHSVRNLQFVHVPLVFQLKISLFCSIVYCTKIYSFCASIKKCANTTSTKSFLEESYRCEIISDLGSIKKF